MSRRKVFFILLILFAFFMLQSFIYIENNMRKPLMEIAKMRVSQIASQTLNRAISEQVVQDVDYRNMIEWKTGEPRGFALNYAVQSQLVKKTVQVVQDTLYDLTQVPVEIPLGQVMDSAILAAFGPHIPVKLTPIGSSLVTMGTKQITAGWNMVIVEVYIKIVAEVIVVIPFTSDSKVVETEIPVLSVLVEGDVPTYYFDGSGRPFAGQEGAPPAIAIPMIEGDKEGQKAD